MAGQNGTATASRDLAIRGWTPGYAKLVKQAVLRPSARAKRDATDAEMALFAEQVQRTGLDPFLKQIYGIYRWNGTLQQEVMQVQVAIDGLRLIADRSGKYEGQTPVYWCDAGGNWSDVWLHEDKSPTAAKVGVYKAGHREPMWAVAHWREYVQTDKQGEVYEMWQRMGALMLGKCAESLALRKAFPADMSGLYTPEEMAQAGDDAIAAADVIPGSASDDGAPSDEDVFKLTVSLAEALIASKAVTTRKLNTELVAAGAKTTDSVQAALASMDRAAVETLGHKLADLQLAHDEKQAAEQAQADESAREGEKQPA